ncbi:Clp protease N-terminal domain-containing protein [Cellulomonas sp. URHD0024]|uniref:Clp protease N-terminal domain-containing protein n=1 Tax=Cellulomonas sp. URHD0024 TaxID=1302620 RepID=UPI0003F71DD7|nr:Clp protease N-terminal domain-containing protein [Cellulomonas sp. URHD0024]
MFERFTSEARAAVVLATEEARGAERVGAEHMLLGMVAAPAAVASRALGRLGVDEAQVRAAVHALPSEGLDAGALAVVGIDLDAVRNQVESEFGPGALDDIALTPRPAGRKALDGDGRKLFELSLREAMRFKHRRIDTGHLLLAVVRLDDPRAARALDSLGLADEDVRHAVGAAWAETPEDRP